jgi:hypothetical protein
MHGILQRISRTCHRSPATGTAMFAVALAALVVPFTMPFAPVIAIIGLLFLLTMVLFPIALAVF